MDYIKVGKVQNTYGLEGKIIIKCDLPDGNVLKGLKHCFLELHRESYIPFFITEKKKLNREELLLKMEDINTLEDAKELVGKNVFIEQEKYQASGPGAFSDDLLGFLVSDEKAGALGIIENLFETPGQVIAAVNYKGKELLIPLLEQTIVEIDKAERAITVTLPDGLIDVYLD